MRTLATTLLTWTATTALIAGAGAVAVHRARTAAGPAVAVATPSVVEPTTIAEAGPTPAVPLPGRQPSVLSVDGNDTPFPAANLTVTRSRGGLHAVLCTDDPPAAMESGYAGNSFMFDMVVPATAIADLPTSTWEYNVNRSSDATGIFLHGDRDTLQPTPGVHVAFQHDGPETLATITGTFLRLDTRDPTAPPEHVQVYGVVRCLPAQK